MRVVARLTSTRAATIPFLFCATPFLPPPLVLPAAHTHVHPHTQHTVNVHMPKDRITSVHQNYGFVEFLGEDDAEYAIKVRGVCFCVCWFGWWCLA